jgi:hypothetical protein
MSLANLAISDKSGGERLLLKYTKKDITSTTTTAGQLLCSHLFPVQENCNNNDQRY